MSDIYDFGRQIREFLAGFMGFDRTQASKPQPSRDEPAVPGGGPVSRPAPQPGREPSGGVPDPNNPTEDPDFIAVADKKAGIQLLNPADDQPMEVIQLKGVAGKGCRQMSEAMMAATPVPNWERNAPELSKPLHGISMRMFQGELYSDKTNGPVMVNLNPIYKSFGREESVSPEAEYPKIQEFRQYALFTMEVKVGESGESVRMMVGNKLENPIRVRTTLNRPFGEELPLVYDLIEERIPLWEWDNEQMAFRETNSVTGGPAKPVAYIMQEHDELVLQKAWKRETDPVTKSLKYVACGASD